MIQANPVLVKLVYLTVASYLHIYKLDALIAAFPHVSVNPFNKQRILSIFYCYITKLHYVLYGKDRSINNDKSNL